MAYETLGELVSQPTLLRSFALSVTDLTTWLIENFKQWKEPVCGPTSQRVKRDRAHSLGSQISFK